MAERPAPRVYIGTDSALAKQMGLCKGGPDFWCGALLNNGAQHKPGCPQTNADTQATPEAPKQSKASNTQTSTQPKADGS